MQLVYLDAVMFFSLNMVVRMMIIPSNKDNGLFRGYGLLTGHAFPENLMPIVKFLLFM